MAESAPLRSPPPTVRRLIALLALSVMAASGWAWWVWSVEAAQVNGRDRIGEGNSEAADAVDSDLILEATAIDGGGRLDALNGLRQARIASRALSHIRHRYVDPDRVHPRVMLEAGLQAVAHRVPEMLVDAPSRAEDGTPLALRLRIDQAELRLDLRPVDDLFHLNWTLLGAMRFIAVHLPADVPATKVEYVAVNGMLRTLDPYSHMLDPEAYRDMRTNTGGRFGGLGIRILAIDGRLTIVGVIENSPAERAGLQDNDQILLINGEDTLNMSVDDAVDRLRGEVGSPALLMIRRSAWPSPREVVVVRAVIHLKSVDSRVLDNGVGYARIKNFQRGTASELGRALTELHRKGGRRGLVLDLRGNPGGLLDEAVRVCDLLMDGGPVVITVAGSSRVREVRQAGLENTRRNLPVAVLVNRRSASASEIVAGALKHSNRALIVGEQTYGKGTVQVPYEIGLGALKLTVAKYLVPGDVNIQDRGVTPDVAMRFISARRDRVRLFDRQRSSTRPRWRRLDANEGLAARPSHRMRVVLPDSGAKNEGQEKKETAAQVRDREPIRRAARLLQLAGSDKAATMLAEAKSHIAEMQQDDDRALTERLLSAGVDWRPGPRVSNPRLRLTLEEPADGFVVTAGETLAVKATLHNDGDKPLYRLHVVGESDEGTFKGIEQVVGRLGPGAERTVQLRAWVSRRHVGVRVPVTFVAAQDGTKLEARSVAEVTIHGLARPDLWFRYQLDEGPVGAVDPAIAATATNGYLLPGEEARLRVEVRNAGPGAARSVMASLRSLSGQRLHLEEGRTRIGAVEVGRQKATAFAIVGEKGHRGAARLGLLQARIELIDEAVSYARRQLLYIPWATKSALLEGPDAAAAGLLRRLEIWRKSHLGRWNRAPVIRLGQSDGQSPEYAAAGLFAPLRGDCSASLRGEALFESDAPRRRFVTVSVGDTKRTYHAGHGKGRLPFEARLALDSGLNRVTIQARAGPDLTSQRKLLIHCTPAAADSAAQQQEKP